MAGGTVTITGGNVIHTFNSSGYLTPIKLVNNSLRFRSSASAYLSRTLTTPTNNKIFTWSGWLKLGKLSDGYGMLSTTGTGAPRSFFVIDSNTLWFLDQPSGTNANLNSVAVLRDPSAWYHIVFAVDTTQATSTNRVKMYINGVQATLTGTYPTQNTNPLLNSATAHTIGSYSINYYDGYMTEINFIDGQALTPNSFGTFNSYGVWQPITYGGSYGTNGFYLPFTNTSSNASANYLVVAGGGGGARGASGYQGGGGGAGGYLAGTFNLSSGASYAVTVGAGGSAGTGGGNGGSGTGSTISVITTSGGGGGGYNNANAGSAGGSGGGGASSGSGSSAGGSGTSGQGNAGGTGIAVSPYGGGGGGGAGVAGSSGATSIGGNGLQSSISGSATYYAGGGGGYAGAGGLGGGGAGNAPGVAGTANTGGGGGGAPSSFNGGAGGSGVVIVSYAGSQAFTGGTVTTSGGNTIHTFTSSGTLTGNFAPSLGTDYSPNGNNWTTNNISTTSGSTYDSMTDVPTLTSATAANYATLNPVNLGGTSITLSNGNLFATFAGASWFTTSSTMGMVGSGKYYFEFTKTDTSSQMVGIFPPTASISSFVGNDANGYGYFSANGYLYNNGGSSITFGATFTTGDVIGIAFDASTGKLWFSKNNTWQASGSPSTGANPAATASTAYTYMAGFSTNGSGVATVNFGQQPFNYTPPTGFVALNTYNL
jgi:hypothetical protein